MLAKQLNGSISKNLARSILRGFAYVLDSDIAQRGLLSKTDTLLSEGVISHGTMQTGASACSRAPGEMAAQQEQMAREQYAQYAPAKAGSYTRQPAQPGSPAPLQQSDVQHPPGGQQAEPASASAPRRGASDSPRQAAGALPEQQYRQPAGYTGAGQPYYYSHEAMSEQFLGYPGGAGHMHPSVYNPYL